GRVPRGEATHRWRRPCRPGREHHVHCATVGILSIICSMEPVPEDLDIQAYCRSLALQQIQMLTRLVEIAMQLAEAEGARAVAAPAVVAKAGAARPRADVAAVEAAGAEVQEAGMAFSRFSCSVQRSLLLRSRAAADLRAGDAADRKARRAGQ